MLLRNCLILNMQIYASAIRHEDYSRLLLPPLNPGQSRRLTGDWEPDRPGRFSLGMVLSILQESPATPHHLTLHRGREWSINAAKRKEKWKKQLGIFPPLLIYCSYTSFCLLSDRGAAGSPENAVWDVDNWVRGTLQGQDESALLTRFTSVHSTFSAPSACLTGWKAYMGEKFLWSSAPEEQP